MIDVNRPLQLTDLPVLVVLLSLLLLIIILILSDVLYWNEKKKLVDLLHVFLPHWVTRQYWFQELLYRCRMNTYIHAPCFGHPDTDHDWSDVGYGMRCLQCHSFKRYADFPFVVDLLAEKGFYIG